MAKAANSGETKAPRRGSIKSSLVQAQRARKSRRTFILGLVGLLALALLCMGLGRFNVPLGEGIRIVASRFFDIPETWTLQAQVVLLNIRIPRVITAILVGAALSCSGAAYQSLFRNPLVSPDILGVSSGACVGAATAILLHLQAGTEICAFVGAILTVFITTKIPNLLKNKSSLMLVLAGVLMGGLMTSIMSFIKYVADPENELQEIVYWTMGSLSGARWDSLPIIAPLIIACLIIVYRLRWQLDIISMGDADAKSLGVNMKLMRRVLIICSTLLTSSAVCISGTIGWIGLVVPHVARLLMGQSNRDIIPMSMVFGGAFMLIVDTTCRTVSPDEIPLSIFTGLIGVPLFIWLLVLQKQRVE